MLLVTVNYPKGETAVYRAVAAAAARKKKKSLSLPLTRDSIDPWLVANTHERAGGPRNGWGGRGDGPRRRRNIHRFPRAR